MRKILLLGGGGHCKACIDVIEAENIHEIYGILVPDYDLKDTVLGYRVIGHYADLPSHIRTANTALIAVGQIKTADPRVQLFEDLETKGLAFPVIQSPLAHRSKHSAVGKGTILMHGAVVNAHATIGNNCIINSHALIEHDAEIGDHCHVSTGARVNGGVVVGERSFVGSGVVIKQGVRIGANVVIGAGQTVLKDLPDGSWVMGAAS